MDTEVRELQNFEGEKSRDKKTEHKIPGESTKTQKPKENRNKENDAEARYQPKTSTSPLNMAKPRARSAMRMNVLTPTVI
jgi:hypothetical protein